MVENNKERLARPINYRRGVKTDIWELVAFLCLKRGLRPNRLIDNLIMSEWIKERGDND